MWLVRNAPCLLAHYLHAAYRYGSEELLRIVRIAIGPNTFEQLRGIRDTFADLDSAGSPGRARRDPVMASPCPRPSTGPSTGRE
ncbi:hypothetical protein GCM10010182_22220 [Actinomadura cremea]|nr:hypothetical protein GCM10010182_22220 [Actinomadura cremea]